MSHYRRWQHAVGYIPWPCTSTLALLDAAPRWSWSCIPLHCQRSPASHPTTNHRICAITTGHYARSPIPSMQCWKARGMTPPTKETTMVTTLLLHDRMSTHQATSRFHQLLTVQQRKNYHDEGQRIPWLDNTLLSGGSIVWLIFVTVIWSYSHSGSWSNFWWWSW